MSKYVLDTMALVLYLENRRLPQTIKNHFFEATQNKAQLWIPAITLAEIGYLFQKGRIDTNLEAVDKLLQHYSSFQVASLTFEIVQASFQITDIPELHDRLIAGTAKHLKIPPLTNDPVIAKSSFVQTFWS